MVAFKGVTHITINVVLFYLFGLHRYLGFDGFMFSVFGSLAPDIDHPKAILGRFNLFSPYMKHRGLTHKIIGFAIFTGVISYFFGFRCIIGFAIGYALHLIVD